MRKILSVYVLFGISPRICNGLMTYTEVPLYFITRCSGKYVDIWETKERDIIFFLILDCEAIGTAATSGQLCQPRVIMKMIVEK
jgi:hypothetical protein